jgi:hypothetical protein
VRAAGAGTVDRAQARAAADRRQAGVAAIARSDPEPPRAEVFVITVPRIASATLPLMIPRKP